MRLPTFRAALAAAAFAFASSASSVCAADAEGRTARAVADEAVAKESPQAAVSFIQDALPQISGLSEKRSLYAFLGSLQEMLALYDDARKSYAAAAGIAAGDAEGMVKKSAERLVIDATRCALNAGEYDVAAQYLNSAVRNSKSAEIQASIKLYEQWIALCRAETEADVAEPAVLLRAYADMPSMQSVKPSLLLTLWYLSGSAEYADALRREFPLSAEAAIVSGKAQILPAPFWYFVPHRSVSVAPEAVLPDAPAHDASSSADAAAEKPAKLQLGLFREESNARSFAARLKEKGFDASISREARASGTTYFLVVMEEKPDGSVAASLKTAGFECYPLFE